MSIQLGNFIKESKMMKILILMIALLSSCNKQQNSERNNDDSSDSIKIDEQKQAMTITNEIAKSMTEEEFRDMLVDSILTGHVSNIYEIVTNSKMGINGQSWQHYQTPLSAAALKGNIEVAQLLLDNGANIDEGLASAHGYHRGNALTEAVYNSHFDMIKFLISNNITHDEPAWRTTHIAIAINNSSYEIADYLIAHAQSNNIVNDGSTIFSLLQETNYSGIEYYLNKRQLSQTQISNISSELFDRVFFVLAEDPVVFIDTASNQIEYLLSLGANINYTNYQGDNIWIDALSYEWIPEENKDDFFRFLFSKNTNIFQTNQYGHSTIDYLSQFTHILEEKNIQGVSPY